MGRKSKADLAQLYTNIGKVITSSIELDDILDGIMKEVKKFFDPENWSLLRYDESSNHLYFIIIEGIDPKEVEQIKLDLGEGVAGYVAKNKKPLLVNNASASKHFTDIVDKATGFETESIIAVPCIRHDKVYGVIELINHSVKSFTDEDKIILTSIADYAAIAFENAFLYENALNRSLTDPLTGLFNHTKLSDMLEEYKENSEHRRIADTYDDILVVYLDCNNFKLINDNYGHRAGDKMLKKISAALMKAFREEDILIRTGGDEFVGIIHIDEKTDAAELEKIFTQRIEEMAWPSKDEKVTVTLSYGFSSGKTKNLKKLIHDADVNMYKKKDEQKTT